MTNRAGHLDCSIQWSCCFHYILYPLLTDHLHSKTAFHCTKGRSYITGTTVLGNRLSLLVRWIFANIYKDCAFLGTSMKLVRVMEHDHESNFRNGTTFNLTFGDL